MIGKVSAVVLVFAAVYLVTFGDADHSPGFNWDARYILGQTDYTTITAGTGVNQLNGPASFVIINSRLYVGDRVNQRIVEYTSASGTYSASATPLNTDGAYPSSLYNDNGKLFIALSTNQATLETVSLPFSASSSPSSISTSSITFSQIAYIAVDSQRNLVYASDSVNNRVIKFSRNSNSLTVVSILEGTRFNSSINGVAFFRPERIKIDCAGGIWVADNLNNRAVHFSLNSNTADVVIGQLDDTGTGKSLAAAGLSEPSAIELNSDCSRMWIADTQNNRVTEYRSPYFTGMTAVGVLGPSDFGASGLVIATDSNFYNIVDLGYDSSNGILWVTDSQGNRVVGGYVNGSGARLTSWMSSILHIFV